MSALKTKKGGKVILCGFTGMKLGVYSVTAATKEAITIEKADGTEVEFTRKDGKQIDPKNPKYANFIIEDDGSYVKPERKKKATKKAPKKAKQEVEEEEEYEEDEEEEEIEEKPKKKAKKPTTKKKPVKKVEEVEGDEDDEEFEEVE
jgi:hypothetical protein